MPDGGRGAAGPRPGLCGTCLRARVVESDRGSRFYLCLRSRTDPRYARYPRLPVLRCPGHEPEDADATGGDDAPSEEMPARELPGDA